MKTIKCVVDVARVINVIRDEPLLKTYPIEEVLEVVYKFAHTLYRFRNMSKERNIDTQAVVVRSFLTKDFTDDTPPNDEDRQIGNCIIDRAIPAYIESLDCQIGDLLGNMNIEIINTNYVFKVAKVRLTQQTRDSQHEQPTYLAS